MTFNASHVEELSRAARQKPTGRAWDIAQSLESVATDFRLARWTMDAPQSHEVLESLHAIAKAADQLVTLVESKQAKAAFHHVALQILGNAEHPDYADLANGIDNPKAAIAVVSELRVWVRMAETLEQRRTDRKRGNPGNEPMQILFTGLAKVWERHWKRKAGVSFDEHTRASNGPFFRFVATALKIMRAEVGEFELRLDPRARSALELRPGQIRYQIRALKSRR